MYCFPVWLNYFLTKFTLANMGKHHVWIFSQGRSADQYTVVVLALSCHTELEGRTLLLRTTRSEYKIWRNTIKMSCPGTSSNII